MERDMNISPMSYFARPCNIVLFPTSAVKDALKTGPQDFTANMYIDGIEGRTNVDWNGLHLAQCRKLLKKYRS